MKTAFRRLTATLLEFQTRRLLARRSFKVVAVSGALGKTSTKLAIATVLKQKFRVLVHSGSFNDEIGLPLACFNIPLPDHIFNPLLWVKTLIVMEWRLHRPYGYNVLVIEVGTDAPGEIPHTLTYLQADIGVVTAVAPEHMEYFKTLDAVAAEELALVTASKQVVVNYDDIAALYRQQYVDPHPAHVYYGLGAALDYSLKIRKTDLLTGTTSQLLKSGQPQGDELTLHLYGQHSTKMAAAAYAVGSLMGLSAAQLKAGLQAIRPVRGRMNPLPGVNDSVIIDDTYNSSPEAVTAALTALSSTTVEGRRIALLGSMNELGADSPRYHEQIGAAAAGVDLLVTLGDLANTHLGPAAVRAGLDPTSWRSADSPLAAAEYLRLMLRPGDVLLAKGSQNGVFAEETVKLLLADPADTASLVRQSPAWLRIKAKQFPDLKDEI